MAEAILLVLFSLLLALAALFMHQEKRIENVERDKKKIEEKLRISEQKLETLTAVLSTSDTSDMRQELVRLKDQEDKIAALIERIQIDEDASNIDRI